MSPPRKKQNDRWAVPAIRVRQWLPEWEDVRFDGQHQRKPNEHFFVLSLPASVLKSLCGIQRREAEGGKRRAEDLGIQRRHDPERSTEIREFVKHGFPWTELTQRQRKSGDYDDLKKPGWLPTSIVVNVLTGADKRAGEKVDAGDLIEVDQNGEISHLVLPTTQGGESWSPRGQYPMEVIDGQHRLWAFEPGEHEEDYQLPVVAFIGLDISWQAYLFWTINIKPKRINASLAFDLYPLLRTEDWLERFEGPAVYRQTRAQELTELLWAHAESPWYHRINMLGERGAGDVSQAAWIRSLTVTFIKAFEGRGVRIGGLFGAPVGEDRLALPWTRHEQAAFLIHAWAKLEDAVRESQHEWAEALRDDEGLDEDGDERDDEESATDRAFAGNHTLLSTDQGVRGFLYVANDISYWLVDDLDLWEWGRGDVGQADDLGAVTDALRVLRHEPVSKVLGQVADALSTFDWRTSTAPGLTEEERTLRRAFRGSGGYRELRRQLMRHLASEAREPVRRAARDVRDELDLD
jgi:DGQHR domain-containing protein